MKPSALLALGLCFASPSFGNAKAKPIERGGDADIKEIPLPFPGVMYVPNDGKPHPGLLILHGSEGGPKFLLESVTKPFAKQGFATLSFCWFNCDGDPEGVPQNLEEVDLEKSYQAFQWLQNSEHVGGKSSGLYGISRGGEQAVLLLAYMSEMHPELPLPVASMAHAPFSKIVAPFSSSFLNGYAYNWGGSHLGLATNRRIEIERYQGPLFISHGTIDTTSKTQHSIDLFDALTQNGQPISVDTDKVPACATPTTVAVPPAHVAVGMKEFHFFECEKHIFTKPAATKREKMQVEFLHRYLGY